MQGTKCERVSQPAFECAGCGAHVDHAQGTAVTTRLGTFASCQRCRQRAQRSQRYRTQFGCAAHAGVPLPEMRRICASIGVFDVPTTFAGWDEALGLPEGSTVEAITVLLERGELGRP